MTAATVWSCSGGGGGEGQQCKHTNCLKHKGGMQTHKLNNLMQDQSLWLERCVTLYYTGIITMNSLVCQDMISVWTPHAHIDVLEFFFFLFLFIPPPPPPPPPFVTDMNPSLFLMQEVKGVGEGVTDITQEGNLCPLNCQFCRNCNTTRWWQNIQDDVLL